jgi:hypothetical protein
MAWAQNDTSRGVSRMPKPISALKNCRSRSMRFTTAIGALQMSAAMRAISSKAGSGGVSRMP